jgi:hypothetical protein
MFVSVFLIPFFLCLISHSLYERTAQHMRNFGFHTLKKAVYYWTCIQVKNLWGFVSVYRTWNRSGRDLLNPFRFCKSVPNPKGSELGFRFGNKPIFFSAAANKIRKSILSETETVTGHFFHVPPWRWLRNFFCPFMWTKWYPPGSNNQAVRSYRIVPLILYDLSRILWYDPV